MKILNIPRVKFKNTIIAFIVARLCPYTTMEDKKNQLHAVSRTQQGRQKEPNVKTLRSSLSAEFSRLSGRTQRRALPRHRSEEMEI